MKRNTFRIAYIYCLLQIGALGAGTAFAEKLSIVRGDGDYPPYEMILDGKLKGVHVDLVKRVAAKLDFKVEFESVPWSRAVAMIEAHCFSAYGGVVVAKKRPSIDWRSCPVRQSAPAATAMLTESSSKLATARWPDESQPWVSGPNLYLGT